MTAPYVISREEHKEIARMYVPKADWASSVTGLLVAAGLLGLAVAAAAADNRLGGFPAVLLSLISMVVICVSIYEPTLGTWIRRFIYWRKTRELYRASLEGVHWKFFFDEEKWGSEDRFTEAWSNCRVALETENLLWLQSVGHYALVPKRLLQSEELSALRRVAVRELDQPLNFRLRMKTWLAVEVPSLWHRRRSQMLRAHVTGLVAIVVVTAWMWRARTPCDMPWIIGITGALLFVLITAQFWYHLAGYLVYRYREKGPLEIECSDHGVRFRVNGIKYFSRWPVFSKFREIDRAFLLYIDRTQYHILPKMNMTREGEDALRTLLKSKLPVAEEWC